MTPKQLKKIQRVTAFLVFVSFTVTNQTLPAYASAAAPAVTSIDIKNFPSDIASIRMPGQMGKVEEAFKGAEGETVVVIQDAHSIPDAQKNIQRIIGFFQKQYGVRRVGLEGASSKLDPQIFKSFPDKKLLRQIFGQYLNQGELTAGTGAAIFSEGPAAETVFQGVEDWELYEQGLGLYLAAMKREAELEPKLAAWKESLQVQKNEIYPAELIELDKKVESFRRNEIDLMEIFKALAAVQPPARGTELFAFWDEMQSEKTDSTAIDAEVNRIARLVAKHLNAKSPTPETNKALQVFHDKLQDFRISRLSAQAFALFLKELIAKDNLRVTVSRKLLGGIENQKKMRDLEGTQFFRDFEVYTKRVKMSLMHNQEQRLLDAETEALGLAEKLMKLEVSREEWQQFNANKIFKVTEFIREEDLSIHEAFYKNAEARDAAFLKNLETGLKAGRKSQKSTLLVAGGFHAQGLTRRLKEKNISYLLVMPEIQSIPKETRYQAQMRDEVSWKSYFKEENGKIDLYKAFVRGTRDKLLEADQSKTLLKNWRDQIIRDLAEKKQIQKAGEYTKFLDEVLGDTQKSLDARVKKALEKINTFMTGLRGLKERNELTDINIMKLVKPGTAIPRAPGAAMAPGSLGTPESALTQAAAAGLNFGGSRFESREITTADARNRMLIGKAPFPGSPSITMQDVTELQKGSTDAYEINDTEEAGVITLRVTIDNVPWILKVGSDGRSGGSISIEGQNFAAVELKRQFFPISALAIALSHLAAAKKEAAARQPEVPASQKLAGRINQIGLAPSPALEQAFEAFDRGAYDREYFGSSIDGSRHLLGGDFRRVENQPNPEQFIAGRVGDVEILPNGKQRQTYTLVIKLPRTDRDHQYWRLTFTHHVDPQNPIQTELPAEDQVTAELNENKKDLSLSESLTNPRFAGFGIRQVGELITEDRKRTPDFAPMAAKIMELATRFNSRAERRVEISDEVISEIDAFESDELGKDRVFDKTAVIDRLTNLQNRLGYPVKQFIGAGNEGDVYRFETPDEKDSAAKLAGGLFWDAGPEIARENLATAVKSVEEFRAYLVANGKIDNESYAIPAFYGILQTQRDGKGDTGIEVPTLEELRKIEQVDAVISEYIGGESLESALTNGTLTLNEALQKFEAFIRDLAASGRQFIDSREGAFKFRDGKLVIVDLGILTRFKETDDLEKIVNSNKERFAEYFEKFAPVRSEARPGLTDIDRHAKSLGYADVKEMVSQTLQEGTEINRGRNSKVFYIADKSGQTRSGMFAVRVLVNTTPEASLTSDFEEVPHELDFNVGQILARAQSTQGEIEIVWYQSGEDVGASLNYMRAADREAARKQAIADYAAYLKKAADMDARAYQKLADQAKTILTDSPYRIDASKANNLRMDTQKQAFGFVDLNKVGKTVPPNPSMDILRMLLDMNFYSNNKAETQTDENLRNMRSIALKWIQASLAAGLPVTRDLEFLNVVESLLGMLEITLGGGESVQARLAKIEKLASAQQPRALVAFYQEVVSALSKESDGNLEAALKKLIGGKLSENDLLDLQDTLTEAGGKTLDQIEAMGSEVSSALKGAQSREVDEALTDVILNIARADNAKELDRAAKIAFRLALRSGQAGGLQTKLEAALQIRNRNIDEIRTEAAFEALFHKTMIAEEGGRVEEAMLKEGEKTLAFAEAHPDRIGRLWEKTKYTYGVSRTIDVLLSIAKQNPGDKEIETRVIKALENLEIELGEAGELVNLRLESFLRGAEAKRESAAQTAAAEFLTKLKANHSMRVDAAGVALQYRTLNRIKTDFFAAVNAGDTNLLESAAGIDPSSLKEGDVLLNPSTGTFIAINQIAKGNILAYHNLNDANKVQFGKIPSDVISESFTKIIRQQARSEDRGASGEELKRNQQIQSVVASLREVPNAPALIMSAPDVGDLDEGVYLAIDGVLQSGPDAVSEFYERNRNEILVGAQLQVLIKTLKQIPNALGLITAAADVSDLDLSVYDAIQEILNADAAAVENFYQQHRDEMLAVLRPERSGGTADQKPASTTAPEINEIVQLERDLANAPDNIDYAQKVIEVLKARVEKNENFLRMTEAASSLRKFLLGELHQLVGLQLMEQTDRIRDLSEDDIGVFKFAVEKVLKSGGVQGDPKQIANVLYGQIVNPEYQKMLSEVVAARAEDRNDIPATVRAAERFEARSVDPLIDEIRQAKIQGRDADALKYWEQIINSIARKYDRGEITMADQLEKYVSENVSPEDFPVIADRFAVLRTLLAGQPIPPDVLAREVSRSISIGGAPFTLGAIARMFDNPGPNLGYVLFSSLSKNNYDQVLIKSQLSPEGLRLLKVAQFTSTEGAKILYPSDTAQSGKDLNDRTNTDELLALQRQVLEIGERGKISAHGVEQNKGGLQVLLKIALDGKIRVPGVGGLTDVADGSLSAGPHGPYYVIVNQANPDGSSWQESQNHLIYLVPDQADRDAFIRAVAQAGRENVISQQQVTAILLKVKTYKQFVDSHRSEAREALETSPAASQPKRQRELTAEEQALTAQAAVGIGFEDTLTQPQAAAVRTIYNDEFGEDKLLNLFEKAIEEHAQKLIAETPSSANDVTDWKYSMTALIDVLRSRSTITSVSRQSLVIGFVIGPQLDPSFKKTLLEVLAQDSEVGTLVMSGKMRDAELSTKLRQMGKNIRLVSDLSRPSTVDETDVPVAEAGGNLDLDRTHGSFIPFKSDLTGLENNPLAKDYVQQLEIVSLILTADLLARDPKMSRDLLRSELIKQLGREFSTRDVISLDSKTGLFNINGQNAWAAGLAMGRAARQKAAQAA